MRRRGGERYPRDDIASTHGFWWPGRQRWWKLQEPCTAQSGTSCSSRGSVPSESTPSAPRRHMISRRGIVFFLVSVAGEALSTPRGGTRAHMYFVYIRSRNALEATVLRARGDARDMRGGDLRRLIAAARGLGRGLGSDYALELLFDGTGEPIADDTPVPRCSVVQYRRRKILRPHI